MVDKSIRQDTVITLPPRSIDVALVRATTTISLLLSEIVSSTQASLKTWLSNLGISKWEFVQNLTRGTLTRKAERIQKPYCSRTAARTEILTTEADIFLLGRQLSNRPAKQSRHLHNCRWGDLRCTTAILESQHYFTG